MNTPAFLLMFFSYLFSSVVFAQGCELTFTPQELSIAKAYDKEGTTTEIIIEYSLYSGKNLLSSGNNFVSHHEMPSEKSKLKSVISFSYSSPAEAEVTRVREGVTLKIDLIDADPVIFPKTVASCDIEISLEDLNWRRVNARKKWEAFLSFYCEDVYGKETKQSYRVETKNINCSRIEPFASIEYLPNPSQQYVGEILDGAIEYFKKTIL